MIFLDRPRRPWLYHVQYNEGVILVTYSPLVEQEILVFFSRTGGAVLQHDVEHRLVSVRLPEALEEEGRKVPDFKKLEQVCKQLEDLFTLFEAFGDKAEAHEEPYQEVSVRLHGYWIVVILSDTFVKTFETFADLTYHAAEAAIRDAYGRMYMADDDDHEFEAYVRAPDRIFLGVPGSAAGLAPSYQRWQEGEHVLEPHNIDGPVQQLALLAGLAVLDQARREKST